MYDYNQNIILIFAMKYQSCQRKAEDGGDMCYGAVGLCLVESGGLYCLFCVVAEVRQQFIAINA